MVIKNRIKLYFLNMSTAIFLGYINFKQGYKSIITYMNDYSVVLTKEAVFDRIFVNTGFDKLDYMEGNNVFHFISPFTFYMAAIFWGALYYFILKKNYHQLIYARVNSKQKALKIIRGPYVHNIALFVTTYIMSIILFIHFSSDLDYIDQIQMIKQSSFLAISSVLICVGITLLIFHIYLKYSEVIALLVAFISIILLFVIDLNWNTTNIVFIGDDSYFIGGAVIGIILILIAHLILKNAKYETE